MNFQHAGPNYPTMIDQWKAERCAVETWAYLFGQTRIKVSVEYPHSPWPDPVGAQFCTYQGRRVPMIVDELIQVLTPLDEDAPVREIEAAIATVANRYGGERDGRVRLDNYFDGVPQIVYSTVSEKDVAT